jgi:sporulation protein YhbH
VAIFKDGDIGSSDRSAWDRKRHRQLIEESIKKNLGDIIAEESIIGQSKDKKIKIPIKGIKEYQFIYGKNAGGTGSGEGQEAKGQVIGKVGDSQPGQQPGQGQAGNNPGEDVYETEITMEELTNYLFEDLQLPDMERKKFALIESERKYKRSSFQRKGIPPHLNKKRTLTEKIKRQKMAQRHIENSEEDEVPERIPFHENDLRYCRVKEDTRRHSNAVVICIMDTSGSMDQTKKYLARSFYFLLYQFVRWKYEHVEVTFIAHTTTAQEVNEQEFFHRGETGGTYISSGYEKALEIIEQRYNPASWNIYVFHCSDGDNWGEDNNKAVDLVKQLCNISNLFGYGEITTSMYNVNGSTIKKEYEKSISFANFVMVTMKDKTDIWQAFKKLLDTESSSGGNR